MLFRSYKQENEIIQEVSCFEIETWASLAKACFSSCSKGRGVRVVGRLKQEHGIGDDGTAFSKVKVIGEHIEFKPNFRHDVEDEETEDAAFD